MGKISDSLHRPIIRRSGHSPALCLRCPIRCPLSKPLQRLKGDWLENWGLVYTFRSHV